MIIYTFLISISSLSWPLVLLQLLFHTPWDGDDDGGKNEIMKFPFHLSLHCRCCCSQNKCLQFLCGELLLVRWSSHAIPCISRVLGCDEGIYHINIIQLVVFFSDFFIFTIQFENLFFWPFYKSLYSLIGFQTQKYLS